MAVSLERQVAAARKRLDIAMDAVYAAAHPRRDIRFSDCRALASVAVVAVYDAALAKVYDLEHAAISAGKAWRSTSGILFWRGQNER